MAMKKYLVTATWRHRTFEGSEKKGRVSEWNTDTFVVTDIHPAVWWAIVSSPHSKEEKAYQNYTWWGHIIFFAEIPAYDFPALADWTYMSKETED